MSGAGCRSEVEAGEAARALAPVRVRGGARLRCVATAEGTTRLADLAESGGYRLRFPTTHARHLEAVQINTGGGVAGGDVVRFAAEVSPGADVVWSTQAAERIYRSSGLTSRIEVSLAVGGAARLDWLPQETILFSGARLARRIAADVAPDASLLLAETVVFGRVASNEVPGQFKVF